MVQLLTLLFIGATLSIGAAAYDNYVYLIRHGEKPRHDRDGLSTKGEKRADCIEDIFGHASDYNIGYILAEKPKKSGARTRPLMTVKPLAKSLGLTVDTKCSRDKPECVKKAVKEFTRHSDKNILICWEHNMLTDIMHSLGVKKPPHYPGHRFDLIYAVHHERLVSRRSQHCPRLDSYLGSETGQLSTPIFGFIEQ